MKKSNVKLLLNALLAATALGALPMAEANVINLGFEQGFAAWDTFQPSGAPNGAVLYDTPPSFSFVNPPNPPITILPYYGSRFAQITSPNGFYGGPYAADLAQFLGVSTDALNSIRGCTPPAIGCPPIFTGAAIRQTFTAESGDQIAFAWRFQTEETSPGDWGFYTLDDQVFGLSPVNSFDWSTTLTIPIDVSGPHTIGFGVYQVDDSLAGSTLLVDAVVPEPPTFALILIGIVSIWG